MVKLLAIVLILSFAAPALAEWGVPRITWFDPGDGPGPPHPSDPGDGPIIFDEPAPLPTWEEYWARVLASIGLAREYGPDLSF